MQCEWEGLWFLSLVGVATRERMHSPTEGPGPFPVVMRECVSPTCQQQSTPVSLVSPQRAVALLEAQRDGPEPAAAASTRQVTHTQQRERRARPPLPLEQQQQPAR
jgi:hypothetical protein